MGRGASLAVPALPCRPHFWRPHPNALPTPLLQDEFNWHHYSEADQSLWEEWVFKKLTLLSGLGRAYIKEMGNQNRLPLKPSPYPHPTPPPLTLALSPNPDPTLAHNPNPHPHH